MGGSVRRRADNCAPRAPARTWPLPAADQRSHLDPYHPLFTKRHLGSCAPRARGDAAGDELTHAGSFISFGKVWRSSGA